MRKIFLLIPALIISMMMSATVPTITIDGNKSDWSEVPMLTQPGTWPMIKVLPAADANLGTNALVYMVENTEDFDPTWAKYPTAFIDKDYNLATDPAHYWAWEAMGVDYQFTIGIEDNGWKDFPVGITDNNKAIEVGIPATYLTDLESKFGFAMYYNSGAWYCPLYSGPAISSPANGLLYKTRSYTTLPGILTAANAFAHQSIGECTDFVDFGLRDNGNDTARWAAFPIELTTPAKFDLTVNVSSSNSWSFEFWVVDVATNEVVQHIDNSGDISSSKTVKKMGVLDLSSVPAGKYMLKVKNKTRYSKVKLYNIILTSQNGSVSNIPCTLVPVKATMSTETCIDAMGNTDTIRFNSPILDQWVKWNIHIDRDAYYNFKLNTYNKYGHNYKISILNTDESLVDATQEKEGDGVNYTTGYVPVSMKKKLDAGDYIIKVQNLVDASGCRITNIEATYEGGAIIAIPDTLRAIDALKSQYAFVNEDGELRFTDDSHDGHVREQYGKWNISVSKAGNYKFTVSANSNNAHAYELTLRNSTETSDIASKVEKGSSNTPLKFALDVENLAIGNYVLNIRDTTKHSHGRIEYIAASYEGGAVVNAPGEILAADAVLLKEDGGTLKMIHRANGDIEYKSNEQNLTEYALWNLHATEAGEMVITVNSPTGGHTLLFELYEGNTLKSSAEEEDATKWEHNYSLTQHLNIPAAGDYTLKLINKQQYSVGVIHSITIAPYVAPADVTMTDTDTDNSAWVANVGGAAVDVQMTRTILGGMYNTICLPFSLNSTKCKALFGNDVELYTLGSATLCGDILNLQFDVASDIHKGTPVLIKTSTNIVDPLFEGVTIERETADHTQRGIVDFRGTFVSMDFNSGDQVLLLLSNNNLAYPQSNKTLKGFRAYFQISGGAASAPVVRGARIIAGEQVVTAIDLVETQNETVQKVIENGQLIIIKDGVRYNVMGIQIQ
jgi:hypothetical protein